LSKDWRPAKHLLVARTVGELLVTACGKRSYPTEAETLVKGVDQFEAEARRPCTRCQGAFGRGEGIN
jgi:hypothetical protein